MTDSNGLNINTPIIEDNEDEKRIKNASILFSVCIFLFIYLGAFFQSQGFGSGMLITQIALFLFPSLIAIKFSNQNFKNTLRLNKVSFQNLILSALIMLFSLPFVFLVNFIYLFIIQYNLDTPALPDIPIAQNNPELFLLIAIIGILPAISEEVLFRGYILKNFEPLGAKNAIILSTILFSLMHIRFIRFPATFILGLIITFAVYKTNSLYTGIFMHFINNTFATIMLFLLTKMSNFSSQLEAEPSATSTLETLEQSEQALIMLFSLFFFALILTMSGLILYFLIRKLLKNTSSIQIQKKEKSSYVSKKNLVYLIPGLSLISIIVATDILDLLNLTAQSNLLKLILPF